MKKMHLFIATFLLGSTLLAQHKDNKWFLDGTAGYAFSLTDVPYPAYENLVVANDTVTSYTKGNQKDKLSEGVAFDLMAIYLKKSGWHYNVGLQGFFSKEFEYFHFSSQPMNDEEIWEHNAIGTKGQQNNLLLKLGIGYQNQQLKNANLFISTNFLVGGGWATGLTGHGLDYTDYKYVEWGYKNTFLKTMGVNAELGVALRVSKKTQFVVKSSISIIYMFSRPVVGQQSYMPYGTDANQSPFSWPEGSSRSFVHGQFSMTLSAGIRYQLTK